MISSIDYFITISDVVLSVVLIGMTNIFEYQFNGKELLNEKWINYLLATILGFSIHGLFANKISLIINQYIKTDNQQIKRSIYDFVRFASVFIIHHLTINYLEKKEPNFDNIYWIKESGLIITGFILYNFVKKYLPKNEGKYKYMYGDLVKLTFGYSLAYLVMYGSEFFTSEISNNFVINKIILYLGMMLGMIIYHLIAIKFRLSPDNYELISSI